MIKKNRYNIIFMIIMALFLLWGLLAFRDYGISWDEEIQRNRGLAGLRTAIETLAGPEAVPERLNSPEVVARGTGMLGIKLPVVMAEYITGFKMSNGQVFRMYHLYNFLLFFISAILLWRLLLLLEFSEKMSLVGLLLYIACPRILADSFYNNKDLAFLSMYTMVIYFSVALVKKYSAFNVAGLAIVTAFAFNTRAIGPLPVVMFAIYYVVKKLASRDEETEKSKFILKTGLQVVVPAIICFVIYFIITPKMWKSLFASLAKKVSSTFNFTHGGFDMIGGRIFNRQDLPWYYLLFTIVLTVPCVYIIFTLAGLLKLLVKLIFKANIKDIKPIEMIKDESLMIMLILWIQFVFILAYTMIARPMQYNYWRHFYFIFVYMVIFTLYGIKWCVGCKWLKHLTYIFVTVSIVLSIRWIGVNHPYEYLYFNPLFNGDMAKTSDQDYWAVSYQNLLSQIVDGSDANVYLFPTLTGNQLFGQAAYENYHLEGLKNCAKYRIDAVNPGCENFYTVLKTVEVDGRIANYLMRRENYGNVLRKYYYEGGEFSGKNYGTELGLTSYNEGVDRCILLTIPGKLTVREIDFIYADMHILSKGSDSGEEETVESTVYEDGQVVKNVRAYVSKDCATWRRLDDKQILSERDIFGICPGEDKELSGYVLLKYEDEMENGADFAIRVYGEEVGSLADTQNKADVYYNRYEAMQAVESISCSDTSSDELMLVLDGKENTVFATSEGQKQGMYLQFSLKEGYRALRGLHIDEGEFPMNDGRCIKIEGSMDGSSYQDLTWYYAGADDYLFDNPSEYTFYRITLMEDSDYPWAISELGLIR